MSAGCQGAFILAGQKCVAAWFTWHVSLFSIATAGAIGGAAAEAVFEAPLPARVVATCSGAASLGPVTLALTGSSRADCTLLLDLVPFVG